MSEEEAVRAAAEALLTDGVLHRTGPARDGFPEDIDRERELRSDCLRLAVEAHRGSWVAPSADQVNDEVVATAEVYARFVLGHAGKPEGVA